MVSAKDSYSRWAMVAEMVKHLKTVLHVIPSMRECKSWMSSSLRQFTIQAQFLEPTFSAMFCQLSKFVMLNRHFILKV